MSYINVNSNDNITITIGNWGSYGGSYGGCDQNPGSGSPGGDTIISKNNIEIYRAYGGAGGSYSGNNFRTQAGNGNISVVGYNGRTQPFYIDSGYGSGSGGVGAYLSRGNPGSSGKVIIEYHK